MTSAATSAATGALAFPLATLQLAVLLAMAFTIGFTIARLLRLATAPAPPALPAAAPVVPRAATRPVSEPRASGRGDGQPSTVSGRPASTVAPLQPLLLEAPRGGTGDRLTVVPGLGPAIERKLQRLGVHHLDQIAAWSPAEAAWIGEAIGFPGRVEREGWVEAARTALSAR